MLAASAQLDARISFEPPETRPRPVLPAAATSPEGPAPTVVPPPVPRVTFRGVWGRLSHCESSGNPRAVSRDGRYFGLFQFSLETWHFLGYAGNPADAAPSTQLEAARRLQRMRGWDQWPRCSRRLGLL
ncbi:MAG TPA: transglycosylase family protein [Acidimicrobiales bacterium]|nr:transglycosylase family protein [Acidimicrobiales bacterium]